MSVAGFARRPTGAKLRRKRVFDLVVGSVLTVVLLPVFVLITIAIAVDSRGPLFHVSERTGRNGKRFGMIKFRTMVRDADQIKDQLRHLSVVPWPDFKIIPDPRITAVGRFLRSTSLDELPQLINVLRGEMSLVGPRPTTFTADTYSLWHTARLDIAPGMTGLWQVGGRNRLTFDERVRLDIEYIASVSVWSDLKLLARTVGTVIRQEGA